MSPVVKCSIIIPVFNDAPALAALLEQLQAARQQGHQVIVVDGGSVDDPQSASYNRADIYVSSQPGRSVQMNTGADAASGDVLWFLHADSQLDVRACLGQIMLAIDSGKTWGRFDVRLSGSDRRFRLVETLMNWRSALTGIATGDQGIFITRNSFRQNTGFADIPLMEDVELSRRLKKFSFPARCTERITTSSRRWERNGIIRTILLMWYLRLAFALGVNPVQLKKYYKPCH